MRKDLAIVCLVVGVLVIAGCVENTEKTSTPISFEKLEKIALDKSGFKKIEHTAVINVKNTSFAKLYPGFLLFKIWGYEKEYYPYPSSVTIAVNKFNGKSFKLPEEFIELNKYNHLEILNENLSIFFVQAYILTIDEKAIILKSYKDIPWDKKMSDSKNPELLRNIIKPLSVDTLKNETFIVHFFTWHLGSGKVIEWNFEIMKDGRFKVNWSEVASKVGDWEGYVYS